MKHCAKKEYDAVCKKKKRTNQKKFDAVVNRPAVAQ
jgi:hypothetical protein